MRLSRIAVALTLLLLAPSSLAKEPAEAADKSALPGRSSALAELLGRVHSHNDYAQAHPLADALSQNLYSVEADIWLSGGKPMVSHLGWFYKGSLEELYLEPLQKRVNEHGSVYGDGRPFYLWVDFKENNKRLLEELNGLLERYPMLTTYRNGKILKEGAVTVILTGNREAKRKFVEEHPQRACRDSNDFDEKDPPGDPQWSWYAIQWDGWMQNKAKLARLVERVHAKGRKIRLYAVPQLEEVWTGAIEARVDQLSVDDLPWMNRTMSRLIKRLSPVYREPAGSRVK